MNCPIYPCFWFNQNPHAVAEFYLQAFGEGEILSSNPIVCHMSIKGTKLMLLNGGDRYPQNMAASLYVYAGSPEQAKIIFNNLAEGGTIQMPLGKYPWHDCYGWVTDKYGVHWQVESDEINNPQKIVSCLLFVNEKAKDVQAAMQHYCQIIQPSTILVEAPHFTPNHLPEGSWMFAQAKLKGYILNALSSTDEHDFDFTPAFSLAIECETQEEIDYYWEKLGEGGAYSMCGWLTDKFGVSWQIVPKILSQLMADPNRAPKVSEAFLKMQKFDLATLLKAAE